MTPIYHSLKTAFQYRAFHSVADAVPGLRFMPDFVSKVVQNKIQTESTALCQAIALRANSSNFTHKSKAHNLSSDELYKLVRLDDPTGNTLNAQHFIRYGEEGHKLTYFIDNKNIPHFIRTELIDRVEQVSEVQNLKMGGTLNWRLTFNTYSRSKLTPNALAGFPFHTDLPANGDITMIFSILSEADLQMKKDSSLHTLHLTPGSLLLLTGSSRWDWQHRLVPKEVPPGNDLDAVYRMSLVLGCRKI